MINFLLFIYFLVKVFLTSVKIRYIHFRNRKKITPEVTKKINQVVHDACFKSIDLFKIDLKIIGRENLDENKNYLIISNHQSLFDIILYYAILKPNICFIAKKSLFRYPYLGSGMKILNHIPIDRSKYKLAYQSILKGASRLKENYSIIIFPEGTRVMNGMLPFKSGTLHIISKLPQVSILPITLCGTKNIHKKNWLKFRSGKIKVILHKALHLQAEDYNTNQKRKTLLAKLEKIVNSKFENNY